jgi:DnaK suppressor protein
MRMVETKEIQQVILERIASILETVYHETVTEHALPRIRTHLSYRSDPHLNELRLALDRIERGEYGTCVFCKKEIDFDTLRDLPTAHFCTQCSMQLRSRISTNPGL